MITQYSYINRIFQKTAISIAVSVCSIGAAQALTLSSPVVQSQTGKPLHVEIDVLSISPAEQQNLSASLADSEIYQAARMAPPSLNGAPIDVKIELLKRSSGRLFFKITSKQTVADSDVDLLIDIQWAQGHLVRDISLSLDHGSTTTTSVTAPAVMTGNMRIVKPSDTAGSLVAQINSDGISLEQLLLALVRHNPDAFVDANVNRIKVGALITLPTPEQAKAIDAQEADREIRFQTKNFDTYRAQLAAQGSEMKTLQAGREITGKLEAHIQTKETRPDQDKLRLSRPTLEKHIAEQTIAAQRNREEIDAQTAQINRNVAALNQIAAATTAGSAASGTHGIGAQRDTILESTYIPLGTGILIGLLPVIPLWVRNKVRKKEESNKT